MSIVRNKKKLNGFELSLILGCFLWLVIAIASTYSAPHILGIRIIFAFTLHILTIMVLIKLAFFKPKFKSSLIVWFLCLNIWLLMVELFFYIAVYATNKFVINISFLNFLFYYAPCVIYCIFTIIFIAKILLKHTFKGTGFYKIILTLLIINILIITLFLLSIHYAFSVISWETISQIILLCVELILFDFAVLGLIYSINMSASLFLSGVVSLVCGDFFLTYSYISQTLHFFSYGGVLWLLGLFFIFFSAISIDYYKDYTTKDWFRSSNAIKSQLIFWCFNICSSSFLIFFIMLYFIPIVNTKVFIELPLFIMIYSVMAIILSIFIGESFERPFRKIKNNIIQLMAQNENTVFSSFNINEFQILHKFLSDIFNIKHKKSFAVYALNTSAVQMVQDIKLPLSVLNSFISKSQGISAQNKITIQRAVMQMNELTNILFNKFRYPASYSETIHQNTQPIFVSALLKDIVASKKLQFESNNLKFIEIITSHAYKVFTKGNMSEIRRMLSNLINNSVESIDKETGEILIKLSVKKETIIIMIKDNGCGIAQEKLETILLPGISFKENGTGLGLSHAKQTINAFNGTLKIQSVEKLGSNVFVHLPRIDTPKWVKNNFNLRDNTLIAILHNDKKTLHTWVLKLLSENIKESAINVFSSSEELFVWKKIQTAPVFVMVAYELEENHFTGLDIIEKLNLKENAILITDYYDKGEITVRCEALNCYLWPKSLLNYLRITLN